MKNVLLFCFLTIFTFPSLYSSNVKGKVQNSPQPPPDYNPVVLKADYDLTNYVQLTVPSYLWSYGCVSTTFAMLIGYYDRNGYWCLYNGDVNQGAAPINNYCWGNVAGEFNYFNSISASKKNYDGYLLNGHVVCTRPSPSS